MEHKNYIIDYTVRDKSGDIIKHGKMKVKNKKDSFEAQIKLEAYLKKKYFNFSQLIVNKCSVENPLSSIFGDIFSNKDNPFNHF